jgi:hypothetical protein
MSEEKFESPSGNYGRIWERLYEGSLAGAGAEVFCLWPYAVTKMRRDREHGATVLLNPIVLAAVFGVDVEFVKRGIERLCDPDPHTKNGIGDEGRRLVHVVGYLYRVPTGAAYMAVRAKDAHAAAQAKYREREKVKKGGKSQGAVRAENEGRERRFVEAEKAGDVGKADEIAAEGTEPADLDMPLG